MSNQEPDVTQDCILCKQPFSDKNVHSEAGWREIHISHMCEDCFDEVVKETDDEDEMVSIDPQELTRLRAVSEWAKEMWKRLNTIACGMQSPIDSAHADMLCQQYDAIPAPEDKEAFVCYKCGLKIKGEPCYQDDDGGVCPSCFDYEANQ